MPSCFLLSIFKAASPGQVSLVPVAARCFPRVPPGDSFCLISQFPADPGPNQEGTSKSSQVEVITLKHVSKSHQAKVPKSKFPSGRSQANVLNRNNSKIAGRRLKLKLRTNSFQANVPKRDVSEVATWGTPQAGAPQQYSSSVSSQAKVPKLKCPT